MGATYWEAVTGYCESIEEALHRAQIRSFQEAGYDLAKILAERIRNAEQSVRWCEEDDPYDQIDFYRDVLHQYRQMAAGPIPEGPGARIELLRNLESISGDWIGNILDVTGISQVPEQGKLEPLSPERIEEVCGTSRPSLDEARKGTHAFAGSIDRGTAIGFPFYEAGQPAGWFFAGSTVD